jgi:hypothetical protein
MTFLFSLKKPPAKGGKTTGEVKLSPHASIITQDLDMTNAGKCLKVFQVMYGYSNRELAEKIGCHATQVVRWRLQENMKLHTIQEICAIVDLSLDEFCRLGK